MKMLSRKILYCCMGVCSMIALSNSAECKELVITPSSVEYRVILSILVDTLNSYKEDSYAAIGRAA